MVEISITYNYFNALLTPAARAARKRLERAAQELFDLGETEITIELVKDMR
jgi:hypothetical protein